MDSPEWTRYESVDFRRRRREEVVRTIAAIAPEREEADSEMASIARQDERAERLRHSLERGEYPVNELAQAVNDPEQFEFAIRTLAELGPFAAEAAPVLEEALHSASDQWRKDAIHAALTAIDPATPRPRVAAQKVRDALAFIEGFVTTPVTDEERAFNRLLNVRSVSLTRHGWITEKNLRDWSQEIGAAHPKAEAYFQKRLVELEPRLATVFENPQALLQK
jgi:hypothetical protein